MVRYMRSGQLLEAIVADLRGYQVLLDLLDTSELSGVDQIDDPAEQINSRQTIQKTDFPVSVGVGLLPAAGESLGSAERTEFLVQYDVVATLQWRQAIDNEPGELSEARMERIRSAVTNRASIGFAVDHVEPEGIAAGADLLQPEEGAQWTLPTRYRIARTVFGDDGPRAQS